MFLYPGQLYFGDTSEEIKTVLGSCVAITLWHPLRKIGGMCHYKLPFRKIASEEALNGAYGDEAIEMFMQSIRQASTQPKDYEVRVFGGGNMFPGIEKSKDSDIGQKNIALAHAALDQKGFYILEEKTGGTLYRRITMDMNTGQVDLRETCVLEQREIELLPAI